MMEAEDGSRTKRPCTVITDQVLAWQDAVRDYPQLYGNVPGPAMGQRYLVRGHFEAQVGPLSGAPCDGVEPDVGCENELTLTGSFELWDEIQ
jgi:hypothetical protein